MSESPERLNFRRFALPQERVDRREEPFDPEREVTEEDWKGMQEAFATIHADAEDSRTHAGWITVATFARDMTFIDESRSPALQASDWQHMEDAIGFYRLDPDASPHRNPWPYVTDIAAGIHVLNPLRPIHITNSDLQAMEGYLNSSNDVDAVRDIVRNLHFLRPDKMIPGIDTEMIRRAKGSIERVRASKSEGGLNVAFRDLALARIIAPQETFLPVPGMLTVQRKKLAAERELAISSGSENGWVRFADRAAKLKIVSAEKIEMDERRITFTLPPAGKHAEPETPPLPEISRLL